MATNINFPASLAAEHLDLTSLITTSENGDGAVTYPSEDTIAALLHARARSEHPYTRISPSGSEYIVLNPLRALQCLNEENRKAYQDDVERTDGGIGGQPRQPSAYELAGRVWLLMSRQRECQTVVFQ
jgi:chitin synthase